jgi:hypothetical protein
MQALLRDFPTSGQRPRSCHALFAWKADYFSTRMVVLPEEIYSEIESGFYLSPLVRLYTCIFSLVVPPDKTVSRNRSVSDLRLLCCVKHPNY